MTSGRRQVSFGRIRILVAGWLAISIPIAQAALAQQGPPGGCNVRSLPRVRQLLWTESRLLALLLTSTLFETSKVSRH